MVDEPGADQSSPVETYVVPDNNVPGLLCVIYLVWWNEDVVECVQECEETGSVVGAKDGMVMEYPVVVDGSTQSNIPSTLARDIDDGTLADDISAPAPSFGQVETHLINENEFMHLFSCF